MSKKTELIKVLEDFNKIYEKTMHDMEEVLVSDNLTEVGKEQKLQQLTNMVAPMITGLHDKAVTIIETSIQALEEKWKKNAAGKITDVEYQVGLTNVVKMIEMGAISSESDVQNLVKEFSGNFNALEMIKKTLDNSSDMDVRMLAHNIPEDHRQRNRELLKQLQGHVDENIRVAAVDNGMKRWDGFNSPNLSIDGMLNFVTDKLTDELELKQQGLLDD